MFAKAQTKAAASSTSRLAPQRTTLAARPFGVGEVDQQKANRPRLTAQETTPGVSWDFSKIPLFSPARADRSQPPSPLAATRLPGTIQAKLVVGQVNDPLEHEADRVADRVMRMPDPTLSIASANPQISRKCAACEEEAGYTVQPKSLGLSKAGIDEAPGIIHEVLRLPGQPLDAVSRTFFEARYGYDFGRVRVHADAQSARSARTIGALAYTTANHIVLGESFFPQQLSSNHLLAHELTHVVQQGGAAPHKGIAGGSTAPTASVRGAAGAQVQRQADDALTGLNMPAFPCDRGAGIELCNTTVDSPDAPNYMQCLQASKGIIDACKGNQDDCLAQAKCAFCQCVGDRYCRCTGIV